MVVFDAALKRRIRLVNPACRVVGIGKLGDDVGRQAPELGEHVFGQLA